MPTTDRLVIFDCDGVLVDSEPIYVRVDRATFSDMGWAMTESEIVERFQGTTDEYLLRTVADTLGADARTKWEPILKERRREALRADLQPIDGIVEALDTIDLRTCVASSSSTEFIELVLGVTGLLERFAGRIYSAHQVERGKPAPDVFLYAAVSMGYDPSSCIVVEDSVAGVKAGRAAGMTVLAYTGGESKPLDGPDTTLFSDMRDLPELVTALG